MQIGGEFQGLALGFGQGTSGTSGIDAKPETPREAQIFAIACADVQ